jgi:fluoroquinolone transport system permease protein
MKRLLLAMRTDARVQVRNGLYIIGPVFSVIAAAVLGLLYPTVDLAHSVPSAMILLVGGSTLLYVVGLFMFEKDEGTLNAVIVSPLRTHEYLISKVVTLTVLATLESILIVLGAAVVIFARTREIVLFNPALLVVGIVVLGAIYTLIGILVLVRYERLTDALVPVLAVAIPLQLPAIYFLEWLSHPVWLIVPTSAPAMLMWGGFRSLAVWEWAYSIVYSLVITAVLARWAYSAFRTHVIMKAA